MRRVVSLACLFVVLAGLCASAAVRLKFPFSVFCYYQPDQPSFLQDVASLSGGPSTAGMIEADAAPVCFPLSLWLTFAKPSFFFSNPQGGLKIWRKLGSRVLWRLEKRGWKNERKKKARGPLRSLPPIPPSLLFHSM